MTQLPFDNFTCDRCGACCQSLIVEAHYHDVQREPRLYEAKPDIDRVKLRDGQSAIMLYSLVTCACPFLDTGKNCSIYATRPVECVMVEAGDAKCQQARLLKDIPPLRDKDGNLPNMEVLRASCDDYGLEIEDVLPEELLRNYS